MEQSFTLDSMPFHMERDRHHHCAAPLLPTDFDGRFGWHSFIQCDRCFLKTGNHAVPGDNVTVIPGVSSALKREQWEGCKLKSAVAAKKGQAAGQGEREELPGSAS
jgi:hypothetical protein